ncbi:response regulator transcription factor [Salisediminibacterium beveridgei]|uniref:DNA-binding response regulator n=1 Tax=Salisediminibacterium beveridgei TaxID=632773 RepID=A0A1D7QTQ3_9BACI|nr:response regulator transcription factor [Salisediminibacterium beveridgei]AOM82396.1 DNA-binding response regulator [Salisediminibacterium beveridgei]
MENQKYTILIADDEIDMVNFLSEYIAEEGYHAVQAFNGKEMLEVVNNRKVDLVLLDVMMPEMDGMEALKELRTRRNIPVIMVTAKSDENDRIEGLKSGADDYIVKPFSPKELVARIEAQLRRSYGFKEEEESEELQFQDIKVNLGSRKVFTDGKPVSLTRKEFDLLVHFMTHPDQVFNREQLLDHVWGVNYTAGGHRTVDTHMKTMRYKMGQSGDYFRTVYGVGYVLEYGDKR